MMTLEQKDVVAEAEVKEAVLREAAQVEIKITSQAMSSAVVLIGGRGFKPEIPLIMTGATDVVLVASAASAMPLQE